MLRNFDKKYQSVDVSLYTFVNILPRELIIAILNCEILIF